MTHTREVFPDPLATLQDVFDQTVRLFHLLRALAEQLHGQGELTAGRRGILRDLDRPGPQTVPQMARARPVSRQHIQTEVNQLEAEGLVELVENSAHKRSRLVRLTARGKAALEAMYQREAAFYATFQLPLSADQLRETAEALRSLRETLYQAQLHVLSNDRPQATIPTTRDMEHA